MYKRFKTEQYPIKDDQLGKPAPSNVRTHTDEWGGYSKPNWTSFQKHQNLSKEASQPCDSKDNNEEDFFEFDSALELKEDESLCKLVGIDIEKRL